MDGAKLVKAALAEQPKGYLEGAPPYSWPTFSACLR
jgi:hypothetical protein